MILKTLTTQLSQQNSIDKFSTKPFNVKQKISGNGKATQHANE